MGTDRLASSTSRSSADTFRGFACDTLDCLDLGPTCRLAPYPMALTAKLRCGSCATLPDAYEHGPAPVNMPLLAWRACMARGLDRVFLGRTFVTEVAVLRVYCAAVITEASRRY
eukprot:CAMPEP_0206134882 /NCGR_PEP_ID=MMETSP1473-20131121/284_1 /ASSEMBLY_ACC=CAM_ASM_001109 /TAXON_ID=1461547 /ORGANISM="Stichococcus sp, Strain RCC1054" /LENGTH=113 /DNA_ID=CAMNT_0053526517 /DNA_START=974 /DNA_END=1315 /DNA_ORIENTATION=+